MFPSTCTLPYALSDDFGVSRVTEHDRQRQRRIDVEMKHERAQEYHKEHLEKEARYKQQNEPSEGPQHDEEL